MEYQNKLSRLRHAILRLQGQDLTQVLLRAAAKSAEGVAQNVYTTEEIFRAITDKIYEATNELPWNTKFELVSDAESLAILKKELIEDTVHEYRWQQTRHDLLEGLDKAQQAIVGPLLDNQYHFYINSVNDTLGGSSAHNINGFYKIMVPIVRRIFGDFPAQQLVGVQPMQSPVGLVYTSEYCAEDEETKEQLPVDDLGGMGGEKICLNVISHAVEAGSRRLQVGWTIEAAQDLVSMYGLDIEAEMTAALAHEIEYEINTEIISDLKRIAGEAEIITLKGGVEKQLSILGITINRHANEIARKTRRGAGNYIVTSLATATTISESKKLSFECAEKPSGYMPDLMEVGTLNKTIKVFAHSSIPNDEILIGYKGGNGHTDAGYIYCPYVPLMSSGVVVNPKTFQPVVSLMTRYGKAATNNAESYYSRIKIESDLFKVVEDKTTNEENSS